MSTSRMPAPDSPPMSRTIVSEAVSAGAMLRLLSGGPGNVRDQGVVVEAADRHIGDFATIAQHDDAVGDVQHLIEPVGDENDTRAGVGNPPHSAEQDLDLAGVQRLGRFVEDQDVLVVRPAVQCAGDRDDRPLRRREGAHRNVDIEVLAEACDKFSSVCALATPWCGSEALEARGVGEPEILDRAELGRPDPGPGG